MKSIMHHFSRLASLLLVLLTLIAPATGQLLPQLTQPEAVATQPDATQPGIERPDAIETSERWYAVLLDGSHAGYLHTRTALNDEGHLVTSDDMKMSVRRGEASISIHVKNHFIETPDHRPIEAHSEMGMGSAFVNRKVLRFSDGRRDRGELHTQQVNPTTQELISDETKLIQLDGDWMTAGEMDAFTRERVESGAERFEARAIDLSMGVKPVGTTFVRDGAEAVEAYGKTVPATRWRASVEGMGGLETLIYLGADAQPVRTSTSMMGSEIEVLLADRDTATSEVDPPELLAASMIEPAADGEAIREPRELRAAVYELTFGEDGDARGGAAELTLPRGGYQRVMWSDERTAAVIVDLDEPVAPQDDLPTDADLAATSMIDHEDERVRELLREGLVSLLADDATPTQESLALRHFVHDYIQTKDLSVGMATAAETARTAQGDCTEHAVLLTALLRARGIPARTVSGLVYVDSFLDRRDVFGFHMWTRGWLDGQWVDLDPSLPGTAAFDATHIALGVSDMADDSGVNPLVQLLPVMTGLRVRVISADGAEAAASQGAGG